MWRRPDYRTQSTTRRHLGVALTAAVVFSGLVVATSWADTSPLGAPRFWPWLLTGLQVLALWSAGSGRTWGWLLGGSVQLPWIAYAVVTTQFGFIPGCTVSAIVQTYSYMLGASTVGGQPKEITT